MDSLDNRAQAIRSVRAARRRTPSPGSQLLLGEPGVEGDVADPGVRAGHQRPLADRYPVVGGLFVGDDLPRVALGREALADQVVEPELLWAADLPGPVHRLTDRDPC